MTETDISLLTHGFKTDCLRSHLTVNDYKDKEGIRFIIIDS